MRIIKTQYAALKVSDVAEYDFFISNHDNNIWFDHKEINQVVKIVKLNGNNRDFRLYSNMEDEHGFMKRGYCGYFTNEVIQQLRETQHDRPTEEGLYYSNASTSKL